MDHHDIIAKAQEWFCLAESLQWKSYDPFDLLLSPYFRNLQEASPLVARLCIQFGKHSGAAVRRLCNVSPHEEATTLTDYLESAVLFAECQENWATAYLPVLARKLLEKAILTTGGIAWGLEFPYATRYISVAARTPNIYQTANAVHALLKLHSFTGSEEYLQYALQGGNFIQDMLGTFRKDGLSWFRYWPGSEAPIVNVQAIVAGVFSNLGKLTDEKRFLLASDAAATTVAGVQNSDGSWYYGVDGKANFVDGYHTGFILQGLAEYVSHARMGVRSDVSTAFQKGFLFFKKNLVSSSGMPRGLAQGRVSLDGQNFAQCIQTFARCGGSGDDLKLGLQMWRRMLEIPALNKSRYRQLRWTYGPAVLATASLYQKIG